MKNANGTRALNVLLAVLGSAIILVSGVAFGVDLQRQAEGRDGCSVCEQVRRPPPEAFAGRHAHR